MRRPGNILPAVVRQDKHTRTATTSRLPSAQTVRNAALGTLGALAGIGTLAALTGAARAAYAYHTASRDSPDITNYRAVTPGSPGAQSRYEHLTARQLATLRAMIDNRDPGAIRIGETVSLEESVDQDDRGEMTATRLPWDLTYLDLEDSGEMTETRLPYDRNRLTSDGTFEWTGYERSAHNTYRATKPTRILTPVLGKIILCVLGVRGDCILVDSATATKSVPDDVHTWSDVDATKDSKPAMPVCAAMALAFNERRKNMSSPALQNLRVEALSDHLGNWLPKPATCSWWKTSKEEDVTCTVYENDTTVFQLINVETEIKPERAETPETPESAAHAPLKRGVTLTRAAAEFGHNLYARRFARSTPPVVMYTE